jgi:hypothetical protein
VHVDGNGGKVIAINIILASIGFISLISSFNPQWHLWGLDYVGYFPVWLRVILAAALIAFSFPSLATLVADRLEKAKAAFPNELIIYIVLSALFVAAFMLFSSKNHLLGDGYVIQGTITQGNAFSPTEPLDYLLHHLIFSLIGSEKGAYLSYAITAYLSGAAFLLILFLYLRKNTGFVFALAVAFTFANMQFFFGYVENYTLSLVLTILYFLSAWKDLNDKKVSPITVIALALAIGFHINNAIYLPSLGYLYLVKTESRQQAIIGAIVFSVMLVGGIVYIKSFTKLDILEIFVPPLPTAHNPYYFTSLAHLFDLINIWLLAFPLLVICPFLLKGMDSSGRNFFYWIILPALLFTIIIDPRLGAPRDWDMLSLPAAPIMAFLIISFGLGSSQWKTARLGVVIPLILFSLLHTGSWVSMNANKEAGYAWLKPLVNRDVHYSSAYFNGYRNKSWATIIDNSMHDIEEVVRANKARFDADPDDTLNTCNLAGHYLANGDSTEAYKIANTYWPKFIDNTEATSVFGAILIKLKLYSDAARIYEASISRGKIDPRIYHDLGAIKELRGMADSAYALYNQAFAIWPDAPPGIELSFYLRCLQKGYLELAQNGLVKITSKMPDYLVQPISEVAMALKAGDKPRADSLAFILVKDLESAGHL